MDSIFEERQAFNFYRSYYEVGLLLDEINRSEFFEAILHYQFTGEIVEPKNRDAAIMFKGQMHSLKKQVTGFQRGKETYPNGNPTKGKDKGSHKEVQEKEEVQVKGKEEKEDLPAKQKSFKVLTEKEFGKSLEIFIPEFGKQTIRSFFDYWTEKSPNGKMKFQLNQTWDSKRRLKTWKSNEPKFGTTPVKENNTTQLGVWNV